MHANSYGATQKQTCSVAYSCSRGKVIQIRFGKPDGQTQLHTWLILFAPTAAPAGDEIYRSPPPPPGQPNYVGGAVANPPISVFEVDGKKAKVRTPHHSSDCIADTEFKAVCPSAVPVHDILLVFDEESVTGLGIHGDVHWRGNRGGQCLGVGDALAEAGFRPHVVCQGATFAHWTPGIGGLSCGRHS